jgi:endonuclease/exonuclease/phosphatase family metal-dependent hydrolase
MGFNLRLACLLLCGCGPSSLTGFSFNIASGAGDSWREPQSRNRQVEFIRSVPADTVCLQEVDVGTDRNFGLNAMDVLPNDGTRLFGPSLYFGGGAYGNGLWVSKDFTVLNYRVVPFVNIPQAQSSVILATVIDPAGRTLEIGCTHLSWIEAEARAQLEQLRPLVANTDLLMGDFNLSGDMDLGRLRQLTPVGQIDQVWGVGKGGGYMISTNGTSDHAFGAFGHLEIK